MYSCVCTCRRKETYTYTCSNVHTYMLKCMHTRMHEYTKSLL